jgi:hypothetical protein
MTWLCWVPLSRAAALAQNGISFIAYWEGEVFGFAAIRILALVLLSPVLVAFAPPVSVWKALSVGALTGLATSVLDRFCFNWVNIRLSYFAAIFGIPILSGGVLMLLFRYIGNRWPRGTRAAPDT